MQPRTSRLESGDLLRADLDALPDYTSAHVADLTRVIKLDSNENVYGPSPRVLQALADTRTWQYYAGQDELQAALARYVGVGTEQIVVANGGDEAIDLVMRATLEPGQVVIDAPPSFEMYRICALANRGRVVAVPRDQNFTLDVSEVARVCAQENVKVICVASPNNPNGNCLPRSDLRRLLELPALVLLDEAYFEYAGESGVDLMARYSNLAIVRTFSKWAGLAGLRIGYVIAAPWLANALHKLRAPYNVNAAGIVAALESLNDADYLMANVRAAVAERERMRAELARLGWLDPLPSATNFLLVHVKDGEPQQIKQSLAARGILIRAYKSPPLKDYIRITIGKPEQNDALLDALREMGLVGIRT